MLGSQGNVGMDALWCAGSTGPYESSPHLSERTLWPQDFPRRPTSQRCPNVWGSLALRLIVGMSQEPFPRTEDASDALSN